MKINEETGKYIFSGLIATSLLLVGYKYLNSNKKHETEAQFELIKKYLVNNSSLAKSNKPILWLHNDYTLNDRNWLSFGSRNSNELNKPIIYLTVNSIIQNCDKSFNICLIDDNSFNNLIPGWNIDLSSVPEPNKSYYRTLALLQLIYIYGGMYVPSSFLCFRNLIDVYDDFSKDDKFFVTEAYPTSVLSTHTNAFPTLNILGSKKENNNIKSLFTVLESVFLKSLTNEANFTGLINKYLNIYSNESLCNIVSGKIFGYYDENMNPIKIDELMSDEPVELSSKNYGIVIPIDNIIDRKHYDWLSKINLENLPKVNNNIGYLLKKVYLN